MTYAELGAACLRQQGTTPLGGFASGTTFDWEAILHYSDGTYVYFWSKGQYITLPALPVGKCVELSWKCTIKNECGTRTIRGSDPCITQEKPTTTQSTPPASRVAGENIYRFNAAIDTDTAAYYAAVAKRLTDTYVEDENDTLAINDMIQRIEMEELWPYLNIDTTGLYPVAPPDTLARRVQAQLANAVETNFKVYPNPGSNRLYAQLGNGFNVGEMVQVSVYNSSGKLLFQTSSRFDGSDLPIPTNTLLDGLYFIEAVQGDHREHSRYLHQ
jgi:hypothetical protein